LKARRDAFSRKPLRPFDFHVAQRFDEVFAFAVYLPLRTIEESLMQKLRNVQGCSSSYQRLVQQQENVRRGLCRHCMFVIQALETQAAAENGSYQTRRIIR